MTEKRVVFESVLQFWFVETKPRMWWTAEPTFDRIIADRFSAVLGAAEHGELFAWRIEPRGRLAEIIVLDQFSRNLYRGMTKAFSNDATALALAQEAIAGGHDRMLESQERAFMYMPFRHSESAVVHRQAEQLFASLGRDDNYDSELRHRAIIERFGRYPQRNEVLGRVSTTEELTFLGQPGSRF